MSGQKELAKKLRERGLPEQMAEPGFAELEMKNRKDREVLLSRLEEYFEGLKQEGLDIPWQEMAVPPLATSSARPPWLPNLKEAIKKWNWRESGAMADSQQRRNDKRHAPRRALKKAKKGKLD